jgi:hypothetical protein
MHATARPYHTDHRQSYGAASSYGGRSSKGGGDDVPDAPPDEGAVVAAVVGRPQSVVVHVGQPQDHGPVHPRLGPRQRRLVVPIEGESG